MHSDFGTMRLDFNQFVLSRDIGRTVIGSCPSYCKSPTIHIVVHTFRTCYYITPGISVRASFACMQMERSKVEYRLDDLKWVHLVRCLGAEGPKVGIKGEFVQKLTDSHHLSNLLSNSATLAFASSFSCKVVASSASRLSTICASSGRSSCSFIE